MDDPKSPSNEALERTFSETVLAVQHLERELDLTQHSLTKLRKQMKKLDQEYLRRKRMK